MLLFYELLLLICADFGPVFGPAFSISLIKTNNMATVYDRPTLLKLNHGCSTAAKCILSMNTYRNIKENGLLRPGVITRRGKRAGMQKIRNYDVVKGSNHNNLKRISRTTNCFVNNMAVGCVNVRSIRNKTVEFHDNITDDGYDLCMITETWLDSDESVLQVEATPPGYCFDHLPRKDRRGGGIGLLCRSNMKPQRRQVTQMKSFEYCEWLLKYETVQYLIIVVYRPPYSELNRCTVSDFIEEFGSYMETVVTTPFKLLIGGDFNIQMDVGDSPDTKKFNDLLDCFNLKNHVSKSTHENGHTLDLIITRENDNIIVKQPDIMSFISDHAFVRAETTTLMKTYDEKQISFRKIKSLDIEKFKSDILTSEIHQVEASSVDEMTKIYDETLANLLDVHAPVITKTIKIKTNSPWYNQELRNLKRIKRKAERKWKTSHSATDLEAFKSARAEYKNMCNEAKINFYSEKVVECSGDQRQLYKLINNLTKGETSVIYPDSTSNETLSNEFATYFIDKIDKIMSDIDTIIETEGIDNYEYESLSYDSSQLVEFAPLSTDQVLKIINNAKTKSSGLDPIPTSLLKQCLDVLIQPITNIVNASLVEGIFPERWKSALVTPLIKKPGLEPVFKNYRPVSNLTFISKIVEKAGLIQYNNHLENIGMLNSDNSAYKCNHSTETLLVKIFSDIVNNIDSRKVTLLVLLDLSAAFDTVNLDILSEIFKKRFHIEGKALNWFQSYLQNRDLRVLIDNVISDYHRVKYGVPQGSCLGPVVFLGYLSSLYDIIKTHLPDVHIAGYADDHQLYAAYNQSDSDSELIALNKIQACISDVRKWMLSHKLKINDLKTEFMIIGSKYQLAKVKVDDIKVGNSSIIPVKTFRNLGVIFDDQLRMEDYVNSICKKGYVQLRRIRQIRKYLDDSATESIIHSFVTSNIDYCNALLYDAPKCVIAKLQKLQNAAARVVCKARKFDHVTPLLKKLHWLPVLQRINYKIAILAFKCVNKTAPDYLCDLVELEQPVRILRSNDMLNLKLPRCRSQMGNRAFTNAAPRVWNSLPIYMRRLDFLNFKRHLKTFLFTQSFDI